MTKYYTKKRLYNEIHDYKGGLGLNVTDIGFDMIELCINDGVLLQKIPFKTKALRGMASIGDTPEKDVILLNEGRNKREQNFDCGHEYVHLCIHRDLNQKTFNCIDAVYTCQNIFIEWQANEGAAEMIVPMEVLLPFIRNNYSGSGYYADIIALKEQAASIFNVTDKVIACRLESLKYEIQQYLNDVPLKDVEILSLSQQKNKKINIKSLNDIENESFNTYFENWHYSYSMDVESTLI